MTKTERPLVGITMGDAAGVGPEIIVRALNLPETYEQCRPLVIGDVGRFERTVAGMNLSLTVRRVGAPGEGLYTHGSIDVFQATDVDLSEIAYGKVDARCGAAAVHSVQRAARMALAGEIDAICTAPLNKDAMNQAGFHYPGHTEMLGELTATPNYSMMLSSGKLRVLHVSTHVALQEAIRRVTKARVLEVIRLADSAAREYLGIEAPHVAVAGVNPHAGENGLFGQEDIDEIAPAIAEAKAAGINVSGPWPGDTVFARAHQGQFDICVAMYHDQGHVAVKMLGFDGGVNTTIGLPIIRTSADHGTAFGRAGQWRASPQSQIEAIQLAAHVAQQRLSRKVKAGV
ncbi:MAG: 4-hydroxythreonine-4-phosphate dehydrogenase PdxA [Chloroflexota bacterium]|nr:MAG: 4-hydroxythreonine-4-phosphate dehydrogenase PdxA [Chloroflexota bacterium]